MTNSQDVQELQEFLTTQGDYSGPISGNFFSLTLQGVKRFQTKNGVSPASGYFGAISRGVANNLLTSSTPTPPSSETSTTTNVTATTTVSATQKCPVFTTPSGAIVDCNGTTIFTPQQTQTTQAAAEAQIAPVHVHVDGELSAPGVVAYPMPVCTLSGVAESPIKADITFTLGPNTYARWLIANGEFNSSTTTVKRSSSGTIVANNGYNKTVMYTLIVDDSVWARSDSTTCTTTVSFPQN